ncbi:hypothetical protein I3843_03G209600, partial [Carya illinoinensis]
HTGTFIVAFSALYIAFSFFSICIFKAKNCTVFSHTNLSLSLSLSLLSFIPSMAAVSSESYTMTNYPIDLLFDLDEVLTLPEDSGRQSTAEPTSLVIMNMPTVTTTEVCSVCIESFRSGEGGKQVPCGHVYHETCIASWLSRHNSCPLCRCEISGNV